MGEWVSGAHAAPLLVFGPAVSAFPIIRTRKAGRVDVSHGHAADATIVVQPGDDGWERVAVSINGVAGRQRSPRRRRCGLRLRGHRPRSWLDDRIIAGVPVRGDGNDILKGVPQRQRSPRQLPRHPLAAPARHPDRRGAEEHFSSPADEHFGMDNDTR